MIYQTQNVLHMDFNQATASGVPEIQAHVIVISNSYTTS